MDYGINGKRALVTGSTAGIGLAAASALAAEGAHVTINGRTQARVDSALQTLQRENPTAVVAGIAADLGSLEGCQALIGQLPDVDILSHSTTCLSGGGANPSTERLLSLAVGIARLSIWRQSSDRARLSPHCLQSMPFRGVTKVIDGITFDQQEIGL